MASRTPGASCHEVAHELRHLAEVDAQHVVQHQDLAVRAAAGADADGGAALQLLRSRSADSAAGTISTTSSAAPASSSSRAWRLQRGRRFIGAALYAIAAERMHGLRRAA